jgi:hypothetical protein
VINITSAGRIRHKADYPAANIRPSGQAEYKGKELQGKNVFKPQDCFCLEKKSVYYACKFSRGF